MIKVRTLVLILLVFVFYGPVSAVTLKLSGTIFDLQGIVKVPGYMVYIKTDFSSPFHYYKTVYSDNNGFYADTVENAPAYPVSFQISVYDCNNEINTVTVLSTNTPIVANFQICVPPYSGCRAGFTYSDVAGLQYQFTDQSISNGNLISWTWSFGDPNSGSSNISALRNATHTFTSSGIYNVKLLIHADNGCMDSLIKTVFIQMPSDKVVIWGHITNSKNGNPIPSQPVMVNTTLIQYSGVVYSDSSGYYADTIAAVPDGIPISVASYDCNNILHSNTVFSSSSPIVVDFNLCLNDQCRAGFSAVLDSNNSAQNTFIFRDLSYGSPNLWLWRFGDGAISYEKNPIHQYSTPGNFTVSFKIAEEDSSGAYICLDSTTNTIKTSDYFNVGGLVFAGKFPINNPYPTGDTGVAYLYRAHNNWIVPIDTARFTTLGYYAFLHVLQGTYIVKAELTPGSFHYTKYLPAYTGCQVKWQSAVPFLLNQNMYSNAVDLVACSDSISGPGSLQGMVVHKDDNAVLPNAEVLLFNENLVPLKAVLTDADGIFNISALPYGVYNLYPEVTGKYAKMLQLSIDSLHPVTGDLQLEVFDHDITGISPISGKQDIVIGKVYPNPVTDEVSFWIQSPNETKLEVSVFTLTGRQLISKSFNEASSGVLQYTPVKVTIYLRNITNGMYFLVVKSGNGTIINTQKIIKNE